MVILFNRAWEILLENRRAYITFNALYYGLILVLMVYTAFDHAPHDNMLHANPGAFMTGPLDTVGKTLTGSDMLKAAGNAFLFNLMGFNYGEITFPTYIIPFAGVALGLYRAVILGMAFSPVDPTIARVFFPHLPTLLLEGQASILAILGAYIHSRALLWPKTVGQKSRWRAYVEGVRQSGTLYMPLMVILLVSAIYGMIETVMLAAL
jgi:hypothetical protein